MFHSTITTESIKFSDIESIKIIFKLTKRVLFVRCLMNNTNDYNTIIDTTLSINHKKTHDNIRMTKIMRVKITHHTDNRKNTTKQCWKLRLLSPIFHAILDSTRLMRHLPTIGGQDAAK